MMTSITWTKSFIILGIIVVLLLSYIYICLIGILYNKDHRKSILGRKYRLLSFTLCIVLSIVCPIFRSFSVLSAAVGSLLGICIVDIVLVGLHLFRDYKEDDNHWVNGCPFEKRRKDDF